MRRVSGCDLTKDDLERIYDRFDISPSQYLWIDQQLFTFSDDGQITSEPDPEAVRLYQTESRFDQDVRLVLN